MDTGPSLFFFQTELCSEEGAGLLRPLPVCYHVASLKPGPCGAVCVLSE